MATTQGHLDLHRQGQHSTKTSLHTFDIDDPLDNNVPDSPNDAVVTPPHAYTQVILASQTLHSDLTGPSRNGAQYLFVSVLDGYIHVETMKTRHHSEYVAAYKCTLNFFARSGRRPAFQRLDNETSAPLEAFALANDISIQYCPPSQKPSHRHTVHSRPRLSS